MREGKRDMGRDKGRGTREEQGGRRKGERKAID